MDLIGSLSSGRLYNQTRSMLRHYKMSILLLEFDERQDFGLRGKMSFQWKGFYSGPDAKNQSLDMTRRLILLTIIFPRLRIIWSPSPTFSAEMIEILKQDQPQPDVKKVLDIHSEELPVSQNNVEEAFDFETKDFLLSLPGINLHNVYRLLRKYMCLMDVLKASKEELTEVLESSIHASSLFNSLHNDLSNYCFNRELSLEKEKRKQSVNDVKKKIRRRK